MYFFQCILSCSDGQECPVGLVWPTSEEGDSFVRLRDVDGHACLKELHLGQWIRNFTQYSSTNCTLDFQWKGKPMHLLNKLYSDYTTSVIPTGERTSPPPSGFSHESSKIEKWEIGITSVLSILVMVFIVTIVILNHIWRKNKYNTMIQCACTYYCGP